MSGAGCSDLRTPNATSIRRISTCRCPRVVPNNANAVDRVDGNVEEPSSGARSTTDTVEARRSVRAHGAGAFRGRAPGARSC